MSIDRHNYEEFFILYMDNELSSEQRREVELFVQAHPDLQEELSMLQQSRFVADEAVAFDDKVSLMRFADCDITMGNYEEWLILYVDNELTTKQRLIVESFAVTHPVVQRELELFKQTKLQREEAVVFPHKESLYRKEETSRRVIPMRWWRMAAAAVLILAVAGISYFVIDGNNNGTTPGNPPIADAGETNGSSDAASSNPSSVQKDQNAEQSVQVAKKDEQVAIQSATDKKNNKKTIKDPQLAVKDNEPVIVTDNNNDRNRNNLPQPTYDPNMRGKMDERASVSLPVLTNTEGLTDLKENDVILAVTPTTPSALEYAVDVEEEPQSDKKNSKFRGFLRKVTRTVEKTTNLKTTDDDGRLLIAGLAIKL